ncbi:placenta-specific gene 8 protein isoform X3 [Struthio camelus]|uniref:placenta-specific gene 8 protein isoform X3 n=1 Tax=Struthio camelus TaxID=8801 RepID=UPI0036042DEE
MILPGAEGPAHACFFAAAVCMGPGETLLELPLSRAEAGAAVRLGACSADRTETASSDPKAVEMASHHVITIQPQFSSPPQASEWQTGLLDCCSDCGVCICGTFCFICLGCQVAGDMDEFCLCGSSVAMRTLYRTRYNISGSILTDYLSILCCPCCSLCQLKRDINKRKELGIFW